MQIGYIRINLEENAEELLGKFQANKNLSRVYWDKISIKEKERPEYDRMMDYLREGDEIIIPEFARFNKTLIELVKTVEMLNEKKVQLVSEKEEFNSGTEEGKFKFKVLQSIAAFEKAVIRQRQKEGIAIAIASGKYKGYNEKEIPNDFDDFRKLYLTGEMSVAKISEHYGVSKPTIYKWIKQRNEVDEEEEEHLSEEEVEVLDKSPVSNDELPIASVASEYEEPEFRIERVSSDTDDGAKNEDFIKLADFEFALEEQVVKKSSESKPKAKKKNDNSAPAKLANGLPYDFEAFRKMYHDDILSISDIMIFYKKSRSTILRWMKIADAEFAAKEKRRLERKARRDAKKKALEANNESISETKN